MSTRIALVGLLSLATRVASLGTSDHDNLIIDYLVNNTCSRSTRNDDVISVHYRGTLQSDPNLVFDESFSRGSPITFILGKHQVITGWDLGLLDMCVGDERMLTIPPSMAYGARAMPKIPASSTLVFGTKLMSIKGVPIESPLPSVTSVTSAPHTNSTTDRDSEVKAGECRLLGPFALVVQSLLGALALLSLVIKRWRERPQRPLPVWFFDASKQVVGTALLHVFNIAMSIFSGGQPSGVSVASKATLVAELAKYTAPPNPCSFYLLNLAIDVSMSCFTGPLRTDPTDNPWYTYPCHLPARHLCHLSAHTSCHASRVHQIRPLRLTTTCSMVGQTMSDILYGSTVHEALCLFPLCCPAVARLGWRLGTPLDRRQRKPSDSIRHVHLSSRNEHAAVLYH